MRTSLRIQLASLGVSLLSITVVQAGVVVHMSDKDSSDKQAKERSVVYAQDGLLRVDDLDTDGHIQNITLFRDGVIWRVNVPNRTFEKLDKNAMAAQHSGMEQKMNAMMQNLPPEQRAMLEQRMKAMQKSTADYSLANTGRSQHVASYSCEVWQLSRDGKPHSEYCVASKGSLPGGDELVDASHKAAVIAEDVMSAWPQMAKAMPPLYTLYGKINGFPISSVSLFNGKPDHETVLSRIERQSLPAAKFKVPDGFTETRPGESGAPD